MALDKTKPIEPALVAWLLLAIIDGMIQLEAKIADLESRLAHTESLEQNR